MSDLVGKPEDRFSQNGAHIELLYGAAQWDIHQDHQDNTPCNFLPLYIPYLYYSKTGVYRGIHNCLIFALQDRLWVLVRTASMGRF